jgi:pilus assembly protein CpaF
MANKGTRRCKTTGHMTDIDDFCYDIADKITGIYGGNLNFQIARVAKSFHYVFQFIQLSDKSQKRLKGIYEIRYDRIAHVITIHQICRYDHLKDSWTFKYDIGKDKGIIGMEENIEAFNGFSQELKKLEEMFPMEGEHIIRPLYSKLGGDTH